MLIYINSLQQNKNIKRENIQVILNQTTMVWLICLVKPRICNTNALTKLRTYKSCQNTVATYIYVCYNVTYVCYVAMCAHLNDKCFNSLSSNVHKCDLHILNCC